MVRSLLPRNSCRDGYHITVSNVILLVTCGRERSRASKSLGNYGRLDHINDSIIEDISLTAVSILVDHTHFGISNFEMVVLKEI